MTPARRRYVRSQGGYTLIEVVITTAIGVVLMAGLTSVVLTSTRAANIATSRVEASGQIRNFEVFASEDFASSVAPTPVGCGTDSTDPCMLQPIVLTGTSVSNSANPVPSPFQVTYTWDHGSLVLDRQVGSDPPIHVATGVSDFSWFVDTDSGHPTVTISLTITVQGYSESQTFLFSPQVNP